MVKETLKKLLKMGKRFAKPSSRKPYIGDERTATSLGKSDNNNFFLENYWCDLPGLFEVKVVELCSEKFFSKPFGT